MDKWWEKIDKTRHGRPYSELNEGLIYDDFKERLIEDMVVGKITINEYDQKLFELNQSHQNLKDHFLYAKSKLED